MKHSKSLVLILFCLSNTILFSQEIAEEINGHTEDITQEENVQEEDAITQPPKIELKIDFPILDLPYQVDIVNSMKYNFFLTYSSPSMSQSLALTMDIFSSMHYGLKKMYDRMYESSNLASIYKKAIYLSTTAAGIFGFAYVFPFGYPWMRQEFFRTTLSRHGINSSNISYDITGTTGFGVTDNQLGNLKANSPYDFIRMNSAGTEAYNLFSEKMSRNYFLYTLDDLSFIPALVTTFLNMGHLSVAIIHGHGLIDVDADIRKMYKNDNEVDRFLFGEDTFNWVYELFRPDETYATRGEHPSGDGSVARYITFEQLTNEERKYLEMQGWLSYLNFVSPLLYGINSFNLGSSGIEGNFALRHYFTSFGADILASIFLKKNTFNMIFTLHNYMNYHNYFPAVEAELVDYPLNISNLIFYLSPRILIGMQPKGQVFKTKNPEFLGLLGLRIDFMAHKNIFPYVDFTAKTKGWVAGNEYLDAHASVRLGVSLRF